MAALTQLVVEVVRALKAQKGRGFYVPGGLIDLACDSHGA